MTTITIDKLLLEQVQDLLYQVTRWKGENHEVLTDLHDIKEAVKAALAAPATTPAQPERTPMTKEQREQVARRAEAAMNGNVNLSWRDALISETEAFHDIKETP